uniref:cyclic nucleotide-binding domain-containing protein 2-like n=1 Tax=Jaculus jaculus TaxID=51337 RepID=UPI001E1AFE34|nr:cyclic nucleotide-binding domain-containing protein 2-like [Jaculus jaculus]
MVKKGSCEILRLIDLANSSSYYNWVWEHLELIDPKPLRVHLNEVSPRERFKEFQIKSYPLQDFSYLKLLRLQEAWENKKMTSIGKINTSETSLPKTLGPKVKSKYGNPLRCAMVDTKFGELPKNAVVAVYMKIHTVEKGDIVGSYQAFLPENQRDTRPFILVSQGAEVIRMRKEKFYGLMDEETKEKLLQLEIEYPRSVLEIRLSCMYHAPLAPGSTKNTFSDRPTGKGCNEPPSATPMMPGVSDAVSVCGSEIPQRLA